jgi:hypothetical protein
MKKSLLVIALAVCSLLADAQIQTPAASPAASVSSTVGLTEVKVAYSRPRLKGRKVFGTGEVMHPYGQMWRTGANNGTIISFSDDVKVEGIAVKKGEYLIFTIPGATDWTIMLNSDLSIGGNVDAYKTATEAARFTVKANKLTSKVETFTVNIADIASDNKSATVELAWEDVSVKFGVAVEFDERVMKDIEAKTKVSPGNYIAAANYYFETGKDLKKALEWITLGIETGNKKAFWNIHTKAKIQKALGDKAGALATAQESLKLAKEAESDFGYIKLNEDFIKSLK